ncbi:hypothetical protein ROHU_016295 [Labeo rohita]|uniref:Uncharacterized protein n=1 Tax=Labeo rohita TaxID=84645 RepID=A0A498NKH2_LABRO|nr:hypothetical protein ROHU_007982 [Labeo rohita]RXN32204.1 hypothetical protein ROHU_016295 [Labeo rohita]
MHSLPLWKDRLEPGIRGNSDGSIEEFWEVWLCRSVPGLGHGAFDCEFDPDRPMRKFLSGFDPGGGERSSLYARLTVSDRSRSSRE